MSACGICVLNFKGGVGKTTLSVNFASGLANTYSKKLGRNFRVLVIDADPQSNASVFMLGEYWKKEIFLKPEKSLYGLMTRILQGNLRKIEEMDIIGQFSESENRSPVFSLEKKIHEDGKGKYVASDAYWPNLHLIPAHYNLNNFEKEIRYDSEGRVKIHSLSSSIYYYEMLDRVGEFIRQYYDFIIIDCPPSLYTMTEIALHFCENIIIPVIPDWLSTNGINWLLMQIRILSEKFQQKKFIRAIVPTLWNSKEHVFSRHIRILNKSLGLWKRNPNYKNILSKTEIWVGLQRLASINKAIESLRPIVDYQATEPARVQLEMMIKKIASWIEE
ncbi:MAG: AAA family ATPase [Leptospiraceae bacterium]|nr:AAA family ATPase [Leptospiraceae bacterium]